MSGKTKGKAKPVVINHRVTVTEERVINLTRENLTKILGAWFNLDLKGEVKLNLVIVVDGTPVEESDDFQLSIISTTTSSTEQDVSTGLQDTIA